jgi:hypothetical protein
LRSWRVSVLFDPGRLTTGDAPPFVPWDALIETVAHWRKRLPQ